MTPSATIAEKVASLGTSVDYLRQQISELQKATQENADVMRGAPGEIGVVASIGLMKADVAETHTGIKTILEKMEGIRSHIGAISAEIADLSADVKGMADVNGRLDALETYNKRHPSFHYLVQTRPKVAVPILMMTIIFVSLLGHAEMIENLGGFLVIFGLSPSIVTAIVSFLR